MSPETLQSWNVQQNPETAHPKPCLCLNGYCCSELVSCVMGGLSLLCRCDGRSFQELDLGSDPLSLLLSLRHAHKNTVMEVKWNLNGNWLLTASRDHLCKLFDIRNLKEELQVFRGHKKEATGEGRSQTSCPGASPPA